MGPPSARWAGTQVRSQIFVAGQVDRESPDAGVAAAEWNETWRTGVEVVAMEGFTGSKTSAIAEADDEFTVFLDSFDVVCLAG